MKPPTLLLKTAAINPDVELQPQQKHIEDLAKDHPLRMMLVHSLGSGKSLSGIVAAEAQKEPYTVIAPASLRQNYLSEIAKFSDKTVPSDVMSYSALAAGALPTKEHSLIFDEAHSMRNPDTAKAQEGIAAADRAKQVLLLSGSPIVNRPGDLAVPLRMLTGEQMSPEQFEQRYVTEKTKYPSILHRMFGWGGKRELDVNRADELKAKLKGHVDYYDRGAPVVPTDYEDVHVEMLPEQARLYEGIWSRLPWYVRYKLKNEINLSEDDLKRTIAFLTGPRQVSLSPLPYMKDHDPYKAYEQSAKLQEAFKRMQGVLTDDRKKGLVFSNFIGAGLDPYGAALQKNKIPYHTFHGGMTDEDRKKAVEEYNAGKVRVMLLGPSGTEGLSTRGTNLVQLLDPHFNPIRPRQAVGRALRYDSHTHLPEELQNVHIQRFFSRLPKGFMDRMLSRIGFDRSEPTLAADDYLARISSNKEQLNSRFTDVLKQVGESK